MLENILKSEAFTKIVGENYSIINQLPEIKHVLSHQHIYACGIHIRTNEQTDALHSCQRIRIADIHQFAVSRLTGKLRETGVTKTLQSHKRLVAVHSKVPRVYRVRLFRLRA